MNNMLSKNMETIEEKIKRLATLYMFVKTAEECMYDENSKYVDGMLEKYNNLESDFNNLAQEIAQDFASQSDDIKQIENLFDILPNNLVIPFLQKGVQVLQNSTNNFENLRTIIKERIKRATQEEVKGECNELRAKKLMITSKTKQENYDLELKKARETNIEAFGTVLGTIMAEIKEETIEQGFETIDEVEKLSM